MQDFRKLKVWEKAHALVLEIYRMTTTLPPEERFGLTLLMRRSSAAIPTGISQGTGSMHDQDFSRGLQSALRSACELEYQLILCRDLLYVNAERIAETTEALVEVKKMLVGLHNRLNDTN
jgi:four helix bundle protein